MQLARERDREAQAGRAERMTDRDRAAIYVELVLIEAEFARAGHHLRAEGLVDLDAVDIGQFQAGAFEHRLDRRHRADPHNFRRHADGSTATMRASGVLPFFFA